MNWNEGEEKLVWTETPVREMKGKWKMWQTQDNILYY